MIAEIKSSHRKYRIDLGNPLDISIPLRGNSSNVRAWGKHSPVIQPFKKGDAVYSVEEGAPVNFNDISFNPHAHGTHTESVGHISKNVQSVNKTLLRYFYLAELVTIAPEKYQEDFIISKKQLKYALGNKKREALIIRTLPNLAEKMDRDYTGTNPPYLLEQTAEFIAERNIEHLLVDLPSVDRESDNGALLAHKAFWNTAVKTRSSATITELIFVPNRIKDGTYILDLQMAPFENDASPSRPVLYQVLDD
ncbi:MAG: cyclase family protein [Flavobacteriaceae bacterium]